MLRQGIWEHGVCGARSAEWANGLHAIFALIDDRFDDSIAMRNGKRRILNYLFDADPGYGTAKPGNSGAYRVRL